MLRVANSPVFLAGALRVTNPTVIFTLVAICAVGVLTLGAHQVDEAGHRRVALGLMFAGLLSLIAAVFGPATTFILLFMLGMYALFIGVPILLVVLLLRRLRRRAT